MVENSKIIHFENILMTLKARLHKGKAGESEMQFALPNGGRLNQEIKLILCKFNKKIRFFAKIKYLQNVRKILVYYQ